MEGLPDPSPILDLLNGFRRSKVLFTLVGLGIPRIIFDKQQIGLVPLARLLAKNGEQEPSHDGLARLLDASVSLGLLGGNREEGYYLTAVAKTYLVGEYSLAGYITHSGDPRCDLSDLSPHMHMSAMKRQASAAFARTGMPGQQA